MVYWKQGVGASIAWVVMNSTYLVFMVPMYFKRYFKEEQTRWYLRDVGLPTVIAFSVCIFSRFMTPVFSVPLFMGIWLAVTWVVSMGATSLTFPQCRSFIFSRANILYRRYREA